jgi:hypothetical protein
VATPPKMTSWPHRPESFWKSAGCTKSLWRRPRRSYVHTTSVSGGFLGVWNATWRIYSWHCCTPCLCGATEATLSVTGLARLTY